MKKILLSIALLAIFSMPAEAGVLSTVKKDVKLIAVKLEKFAVKEIKALPAALVEALMVVKLLPIVLTII